MDSAITLDQSAPPSAAATEMSGAPESPRSLGEITPCRPTWASV